jgi:hypothetical protein
MTSNVFTGRTGLILGIVFVLILGVVLLVKNFRSGVYGGIRISILVLSSMFFLQFTYDFDLDAEASAWAFEWVDYFNTGKIETASTQDLENMLFLPNNLIDLLFGIGFFEGDSRLYSRSDSGYLKTLFSIGVILGTLLYFVIGRLFFNLSKVSRKYHWLVVLVLAYMFFVEIKEPFLYQNFASRLILLLSGASLFVLSHRRRHIS